MDMYAVSGETLTGIADAIRSKTGNDDFLPVAAMAAAIEGISGGDARIEYGEYTGSTLSTAASHTIIRHNLGVIPEIFIMWQKDMNKDDTDNTLKILAVKFGATVDFAVFMGRRSISSNTIWSGGNIIGKYLTTRIDSEKIDIADNSWAFAKIQPNITYAYMFIA